jgi:CBS domain containing-hemolysin-like protein
VVWFVTLFSSLVTKLISRKPHSRISLDGIIHVVNMAREAGILKDYQDSMVKSVFRFNETPVEAIMTHRTEVFSLDANKAIADVLQIVNREGYSRIPVYDGHPEKIVGIVLAKDIMDRVIHGKADLKLKEIMIKPLFVSETRKVNELFWQFKKARLNLAVVMDEYGGLAGIVTQEDVVEELFGELYDEDEEKGWEKITALPEGCYRVMGTPPSRLSVIFWVSSCPREVRADDRWVHHRTSRPLSRRQGTIEIPEGKLVVESVYRNKVRSVRYIRKNLANNGKPDIRTPVARGDIKSTGLLSS